MVSSVHTVACPCCGVTNDYEIQRIELVDNDVQVSYICSCGCHYTNTYALVYMGGCTNDYHYDRDNLIYNFAR
jgi:hypothetical protein